MRSMTLNIDLFDLDSFRLFMMNPIEIGIVTGFHAEAIEEEIKTMDAWHLPIQVIRSANPQDGQSSSVRLGLEALKSDYDALLVALSDQPNIQAAELQSLLEQFMHRETNQEVVLPRVNGQRGKIGRAHV